MLYWEGGAAWRDCGVNLIVLTFGLRRMPHKIGGFRMLLAVLEKNIPGILRGGALGQVVKKKVERKQLLFLDGNINKKIVRIKK